jgi:hypothetical protein
MAGMASENALSAQRVHYRPHGNWQAHRKRKTEPIMIILGSIFGFAVLIAVMLCTNERR